MSKITNESIAKFLIGVAYDIRQGNITVLDFELSSELSNTKTQGEYKEYVHTGFKSIKIDYAESKKEST